MVSLINTSNLKFKIKTLISVDCERKAILNNNIDFVTSDECNLETPQRASIQNQINAPIIETSPVITSQKNT